MAAACRFWRFHGAGPSGMLRVGTAWYMAVYAGTSGQIGLMTVLGWCVFPFVLPDLVKIGLALALTKRLSGVLPV